VRRDRKQRGGWYWCAYHQINGTLRKHYLGTSDTLDLERLHDADYAFTLHTRAVRPPR
jgi:LuxR family maltose regulon positive regulatory protein